MAERDTAIKEVEITKGQATESECNTPAGAEDFNHTAQAKAAIPEKEGNIQAATGPVMGKAGIGDSGKLFSYFSATCCSFK